MATTVRPPGVDVPLRSQSVRTPRTRPDPLARSEPSPSAGESSSSRPQRHASQRTPVASPRAPPSSHEIAPPPPASAKAAEPPASTSPAQPDSSAIRDYVDPKGNRFKVKVVQGQSGRRYFLYKTIGQGSMGKVKLAKMENSDEELACKVIIRPPSEEQKKDDQKKNEEAREERNVREAKIVSLLNHPYICGLRDHLKTKWHWYMFFEYVNGGQMLDYIISHGKLKEKQARKFARQIASAVDYCHRNSIVHRDLKIENILISKTGDIKIIDFGLSNLFSPFNLNKLRTFCGSLYFAAPELLQANPYTGPEVDVWSFGVVLFVLVCGKVPFDDQLMPALHAKIKKGVVDYPNWLSTECKHLISRMLVTDSSKRATMQEVMNHPWMLKGYNGPPDNYYPHREALTLPLDLNILAEMRGFNFHDLEFPRNKDESQEDYVARVLPLKIQSPRYQSAVRRAEKDRDPPQPPPKDAEKKQGFRFDFYKRRNSTTSRDTLTNISCEALSPGEDPYNAYDPMISMYYLIQEKWDRDRRALSPQAPASPLPSPRSSQQAVQSPQLAIHPPPKSMPLPSQPFAPPGAQRPGQPPQAQAPAQATLQLPQPPSPLVVKEKYSLADMQPPGAGEMRPRPRTRSRSHSVDQTRDLPPKANAGGTLSPDSANPVKESLLRRLSTRRRVNREPQSADGRFGGMRSASMRAPKSLGQARRESIEVRRVKREAEMRLVHEEEQQHQGQQEQYLTPPEQVHTARDQAAQDADADADDGVETRDQSGASNDRLDSEDPDLVRPVLLKGIFSVSTTSTRPLGEIRSEIRRVLRVLGIDHTQTRGGFRCTRVPSIVDNRNNNDGVNINAGLSSSNGGGHSNNTSYRDYDYSPVTADAMPTASTASPRSAQPRQKGPAPGEITFEVVVVKVPMLSIYGVQFKRVGGDTWQYKALADQIVKELRL